MMESEAEKIEAQLSFIRAAQEAERVKQLEKDSELLAGLIEMAQKQIISLSLPLPPTRGITIITPTTREALEAIVKKWREA